MKEQYLKPLPQNTSLCIFKNDELFFSSKGKWLHPLFDFEDFLNSSPSPSQVSTGSTSDQNNINENIFSAHDTFVGKAAVVLMIRFGITKIHANTASNLALKYVDYLNKNGVRITFSYEKLIERLLCKTEEELENLTDSDQMYQLLKARRSRSLS